MELKDVLGEIESDGANLVHGRLLEWALTPPLWHAEAVGGRPHHQGRTDDLREAAQNPISDLISLPFQNNLNFATGKDSQPQDVLNIQPVIPIKVSEDWNLITRWILPVISQPPITIDSGRKGGLGDLNPSFFFSPREPVDGRASGNLGPCPHRPGWPLTDLFTSRRV